MRCGRGVHLSPRLGLSAAVQEDEVQARRGGDGPVAAAGLLREEHRIELVRVRVRVRVKVRARARARVRMQGGGEGEGEG